jgi:sugar phosphate isomerase/epimerase
MASHQYREQFANAPLKTGVHTFSLKSYSFDEALSTTRRLGVPYIGLNPVHLPLDSEPQALRDARSALAAAELTPLACGVVRFGEDKAAARQAFCYARELGLPTIVASVEPAAYDHVEELAGEFGIRIAIHNHGPKSRFPTPADLLEVIGPRSPLMGACVDVGHYERAGVPAEEAVAQLEGRVYDVHMKDIDRREADGEDVVLGQGVIDIPAVLRRLVDQGFDGHLALEYEGPQENAEQAMAACFDYLEGALGDLPGARA